MKFRKTYDERFNSALLSTNKRYFEKINPKNIYLPDGSIHIIGAIRLYKGDWGGRHR
jgi:hypothetical protein